MLQVRPHLFSFMLIARYKYIELFNSTNILLVALKTLFKTSLRLKNKSIYVFPTTVHQCSSANTAQ